MADTAEAHHLMELVHRHLDQLYQHSANQMEAIEQRSLESDDAFVAFDELDEHSLVVDQHLHQLNGNIDAIDRILNELSDENCNLHARLTALRVNLDGATARLHNAKRSDNQKSMKHWEELRVHLDSCHSELTLTKDVLVRRMQEKQLKLTAEYVKNQEYENAVVELDSLKGDVGQELKDILDEVYTGDTEEALKVILFFEQLQEDQRVVGLGLLFDLLSKYDHLVHPVALIMLGLISQCTLTEELDNLKQELHTSVHFLGQLVRSSRQDLFTQEICAHLSLDSLDLLMMESYQEDLRPACTFVRKLPKIEQRIQCCTSLLQKLDSEDHCSEHGIIILANLIKSTMDLPNFQVAKNANELITLKSQLPPPIIDIFWHEVRLKFGQYYMEVKSTAVHRNFNHGMDWDYLSSKAGRHEFIPFNHGEEFELRNVTTQLRLIEKDQHLRWSAGEGDRWQLVPKRNQRFWIRNVRTGNYVCSCMAHGFGSLDADTENAIAIKFRCLRVDGDEEEEGGHFDVEISKFELERKSSECKMM